MILLTPFLNSARESVMIPARCDPSGASILDYRDGKIGVECGRSRSSRNCTVRRENGRPAYGNFLSLAACGTRARGSGARSVSSVHTGKSVGAGSLTPDWPRVQDSEGVGLDRRAESKPSRGEEES